MSKKSINRFLILSTMNGFSWGGSEELWYETALHALSKGVHVEVVVFRNLPLHQKLKQLKEQGAVVHFIGEREVVLPPVWKRVLLKVLRKSYTVNYTNRYAFIKELEFDFVLLNQGGTADITYYPDLLELFEEINFPFAVLNHHNHEYRKLLETQQISLQQLFQKARHVFFVAERNKQVTERQLASFIPKAELVKNPVNLLNPEILKWPLAEVPHFATVARLDVDFKGQDVLLQTIAAEKWRKRSFRLSLFGRGPDALYLERLIDLYELREKVSLKGHADNLKELWSEHHLLILSSHSEGTPLTVVEAMLCGRPCVVTDVGDNAALVKDNETGWVAYTSSVKALDEALERAWQQQALWKTIGIAAHTSILDFIDPHPGATLFEKIVNE